MTAEQITQCHCGCARSVHVDRAGYCTLCGVCPRYRVRTEPLAAPVAQEAPGYGPFDMENGIAPAECRCTMTSEPVGWEGYNGPEPAQWEQADDCPVHPLTADFPPAP